MLLLTTAQKLSYAVKQVEYWDNKYENTYKHRYRLRELYYTKMYNAARIRDRLIRQALREGIICRIPF